MTSGWESVALGEVVTHRKEFIEINDSNIYKRCRVQLHAKGIVLRDVVQGIEIKTKRQQVCRHGEFLVAEIDAKMGGFGIVPDQLEEAIVSSHYFLFAVNEQRLERKFLDLYSKTADFKDQVTAQGSTNYAAIRPRDVLGYTIPLPPLEEQRRIVARVEALAARIEEARGLRKAVTQESRFFDAGITSQLFDNSDWTRKSVDELCDVRSGVQKSANRLPGANPRRYVTVAHVQRNHISTDDPRFFEVSPEEFERWKLLRGDVLVVEGNGNIEHVGRSALFGGEIEDCIHQNHVIRVRPNQAFLLPEFLNAFFNSPVGRSQMLERSRTTSGLYTLSTGRIREIMIPLPSLETQRTIMKTLDDHRQRLATLERLQTSTRLELDALLPAVLAKAFAGEL